MGRSSTRKRRCPGCKEALSEHAFGPASSRCAGPPNTDNSASDNDSVLEVVEDIDVPSTHDAVPDTDDAIVLQQQRNEQLREELETLRRQQELLALEEKGASLEAQVKEAKAKSASKTLKSRSGTNATARSNRHTLDDLRGNEHLQDRVDRHLAKLDFHDSSSSSSDDDDSRASGRQRSVAIGKSLKSGKTVKPTSRVLHPQLWPHSELNSASRPLKDLTYDKLCIEEFVAGYTSILHAGDIAASEKRAREAHLIHLMYLAQTYEWSAVLAYHGTVLLEIERGRARWGDSFHHLDARVLQGRFKGSLSRSTGSSTSSGSKDRPVLFCRDFQRGTCTFQGDHNGSIRGEMKFLRHICATCWMKKREKRVHREQTDQCPLHSSEVKPSSSASQ